MYKTIRYTQRIVTEDEEGAILPGMGKPAYSWFWLLLVLLYGTTYSFALAQEIHSPQEIGYYCHPDTESIVEGQYYQPSSEPCFYQSASLGAGFRYGDIYHGTIGSSTIVNGHALQLSDNAIEFSDPASFVHKNVQQGDDVFVVIYQLRNGPAFDNDLSFFRQYFTGERPTPPHLNYGFIRFKYGVQPTTCLENCNSNVLFLPGTMGSRLFEDGNQLWEPASEQDIVALYLDEQGQSMRSGITAEEVMDTFDAPFILNVDIYESFLSDLSDLKESGEIVDFAAVAYDWRLSIPDILSNNSIEDSLRALASTSRTEKVTIIAHSNGGLVAKALLNDLGPEASGLVDQLILVGVPQTGTPQAIGALLHGADSGIPFRYSAARARDFARNSPMAYHLLPHTDYFNNAGVTINEPLIVFEAGVPTQLTETYGSVVGNISELDDFLLGIEGRAEPRYDDLKQPAIGNEILLQQARSDFEDIGAAWIPPEGVIVHQIAGIGEDTLAGITYSPDVRCVERHISQTSTPSCLRYEEAMKYTPKTVIAGDGTVVTPSALAMSTSTNSIKRWWINLDEHNKFLQVIPLPSIGVLRVQHGNILEALELRDLVLNQLSEFSSTTQMDNIYNTPPLVNKGSRLRFVLHSPLSLTAHDFENNKISENIAMVPGATFRRYGEVQVITIPSNTAPTLHLNGIAEGSFTLEIEEYSGNDLVSSSSFSGIPSSTTTVVSMAFPDGTIENAGDMKIDYDGNGDVDISLAPGEGQNISLPKIPLTVTARDAVVLLGETFPDLTADITGFVGNISFETSRITGEPSCNTAVTPESPAGKYSISCSVGTLASDAYEFDTFRSGMLTIAYNWNGFSKPIHDQAIDPNTSPVIFKAGSTVPVKFELTDSEGNIVQSKTPPRWLEPQRGNALNQASDEIEGPNLVASDLVYRWDEKSNHYIYNWKTEGAARGYWYTLGVELDDGSIKKVIVGLR